MTPSETAPPVAICVLVYGDYPALARQSLGSIILHCERSQYELIVGANHPGPETLQFIKRLEADASIDRLIVSPNNINKSPMMRRMLAEARTEFIWWFDDDSYITAPSALSDRLAIARASHPEVVMWGEEAYCDSPWNFWNAENAAEFVRTAPWYRGLTPPFWAPGGKGELNYNNQGAGDGRWRFLVGGGWFARTAALKHLDWPDPRLVKLGEDVFLGEAVRQQGWKFQHIGAMGVVLNSAPRRGDLGISLDAPPIGSREDSKLSSG
jgi:GT2 family glycosyltransferase